MSNPGQVYFIEQGLSQALAIILIADDMTELTLSGTQYITIYAPGGSELLARTSTGIAISGSTATLTQTFSDADYPRRHGFKALWELTDGVSTYQREQWFSVVRRVFRSSLTDTAVTNLHPTITQQNQQANLSLYKKEAWEEIESRCAARIPKRKAPRDDELSRNFAGYAGEIDAYPGNFFSPEKFRQCHLYLTLSWFFLHNSFGNLDQNHEKAEHFRALGMDALDRALQGISFDRNDSGSLDSWEQDFVLTSGDIVR